MGFRNPDNCSGSSGCLRVILVGQAHGQVQRFVFPPHQHRHRLALGQFLGQFHELAGAFYRAVIDLQDDVVRIQAGVRRRPFVQRGDQHPLLVRAQVAALFVAEVGNGDFKRGSLCSSMVDTDFLGGFQPGDGGLDFQRLAVAQIDIATVLPTGVTPIMRGSCEESSTGSPP
jgi:hypothetical protein